MKQMYIAKGAIAAYIIFFQLMLKISHALSLIASFLIFLPIVAFLAVMDKIDDKKVNKKLQQESKEQREINKLAQLHMADCELQINSNRSQYS